MYDKILFIGNGFDLDLGFQTRYTDFIKSPYYPNDQSGLIAYIKEASKNNWIDLEIAIQEYMIKNYKASDFDYNKEHFFKIRDALRNYIRSCELANINENSVAYRFLRRIKKNTSLKIYSFNYTDVEGILKYCHKSQSGYDITHIHGSLKDGYIVIGIDNKTRFDNSKYNFMKKSIQIKPSNLSNFQDIIDNSNEIIFFGLSLGITDQEYFNNIFSRLSRTKVHKKITIFTYDGESEKNVKEQIDHMCNGKLLQLFIRNPPIFYKTSDPLDKDAIDKFLKEFYI
ncbi:AbiH family protein [Bacteroides faecium]|uniref:SIR2-like domain-containing protein n=1 Tax=Bacteroides faecium TaxID=2715212 RepID=A0A6H0KLM8_9BACE|nr:AbiH family protein [Bacteroides faecium]QIU94260.1 hypothetical protein BacF7301_08905 [Bacteroides faecium]